MPHQATQLWQPSTTFIENSGLFRYQQWLERERQLSFSCYEDMWRWSAEQPAEFWASLWDYFDIIHHSDYTSVLSEEGMPGTRWFTGATLNYAEHIFRHQNNERPAFWFQNEENRKAISWTALKQQVIAMQNLLRQRGVGIGDRVAGYLPNIPEAIVAFLATTSLGAVWSCCSPDFGVETVIERFAQIDPKVLIAVDGYRYAGKRFDRIAAVTDIQQALCLEADKVIQVGYLNPDTVLSNGWTYWRGADTSATDGATPIFTAVPFDHPIWVLYSSGTTGRPKAITHSHGGVLLEHLKYLSFHNDAQMGENFFWFSTTGWMMWNFLQASMLVGAVPVLYDGSPGYPSLDVLWQMAAELPIQHFGTSAPYLTACMKRGVQPNQFDLSALRSLGSTGAPLPPEAFRWIYDNIKSDLWLCSMSGGTDVCTAFVGGVPYAPVYQGHIQGRALGCALYAYNEQGEHITGSLGEMVIEQPMPSMPIYFWNDPDHERYRNSYFTTFPGKWRHGDWIKLFEDGSLVIHGRSDATLNRKGVRIGTAEIYNVLDKISALADSLVLNLEQDNGDDVMPLFVVLAPGQTLDDSLQQRIRSELRQQCSPRHVPDSITVVPDIPYTLSGKKMEVPVKKIFMGMDISSSLNRDAVRNPEALDHFIALAKG